MAREEPFDDQLPAPELLWVWANFTDRDYERDVEGERRSWWIWGINVGSDDDDDAESQRTADTVYPFVPAPALGGDGAQPVPCARVACLAFASVVFVWVWFVEFSEAESDITPCYCAGISLVDELAQHGFSASYGLAWWEYGWRNDGRCEGEAATTEIGDGV